LRQHVGGADGLYLFQIWARLSGEIELTRGLTIAGTVGKNIYSQFDRLRVSQERSNVPRVRSLIDKYLAAGKNNLVQLYANYMANVAPDWYASIQGGIFEEMYAGVGGEVLYRPFNSRLAVGLSLHHVWQRDFDQRLDFLDYDTTTGHLSLYYDWPIYNLQSVVHIGRYLARDVGATLQLQREFDSGIVIGAFATKTNLSAQEFGEGSFDKGFFLSVPLDLFFLRPTRNRANFVFKPLTRDGGQMVAHPLPLMGVVGDDRLGPIFDDWTTVLD
jgi:exopolysaccharide biosynthesis protein YbjH